MPASELRHVIDRLNPQVTINGILYVLAIHLMAAVPASQMEVPKLDLTEHGDTITAALDFAFQGF